MPKPFNHRDKFFLKAKQQNLRARSVFKLEEIDKKLGFIKTGNKVLDLGAAPGSWTLYASKKVGDGGRVVAVDLQRIKPFSGHKNIDYYQNDVFSLELENELLEKYQKFDVLLSDMAPKTTGIKANDQWASVELCLRVLDLAEPLLKKKGDILFKVFQGEDFNLFFKKAKNNFEKVSILKPEAVRSSSREVYVYAHGFRNQ